MIPQSDDGDTFKGCADVWAGLSGNAWKIFSDPTNFGKDLEGVKGLNRDILKDRRYNYRGRSFIGRNAGDMEAAAVNKDWQYLEYANKFASFFAKGFLVKRMFEVLNAEDKPEYIGLQEFGQNN